MSNKIHSAPLFALFILVITLIPSRPDATVGAAVQAEMKPYAEQIPETDIKFEMVPIPGGTFRMGSQPAEAGRAGDEGPQHEVRVGPFWMGKHEVTWDEYDAFAFRAKIEPVPNAVAKETAGSDALTKPTPPYADESFGYGKGKQPVLSVTWHAAMEYCRWLSARTGKTYRLPTEAEWEYACRAGSGTAYSFGDDPKMLDDYAWHTGNSGDHPHPGGRKKPNAWGLYDMHGNLAEWCLDQYDSGYYKSFKPTVAAIFPVLLPDPRRYPHVVRGGSWDDKAPELRSAARRTSESDWSLRDPQDPQSIWWHTEAVFVGFRVVRPFEEQENLRGFRSKITRSSQ